MRLEELTQGLFESPLAIEPLDDHVINTTFGNHKYYNMYIRKDNDIVPLTNEINIYSDMYKRKGHIFAADPKVEQIYYLLNYETSTNPILGKYVAQTWLWIDKNIGVVKSLPTKYFFELVDEYGTIVTDSEQTPDGKKFWIKRIKDAFTKNLNVYYFNFITSELVKLNSPNDVSTYDAKYQIYSQHETSLDKVFVITRNNL